MKKSRSYFIILCVMICVSLLLSSCGENGFAREAEYKSDGYGGYSNAYGDENAEYASGDTAVNGSYNIVVTEDRLLVYTVSISVTAEDTAKASGEIQTKLGELGGYLESSSVGNNGRSDYTYRVPTEKLSEFLSCIEGTGKLERRNINSEDVTERYTAASAQKEALKEHYEAIKLLLERAESDPKTSYEDLMKLTGELVELSARIDGLSKEMDSYKKRADYSTVMLSLYEEDKYVEPGFFTRISETFSDSTESLGTIGEDIVLLLVALVPFLAAALAIFVLYVLIKLIVCLIRKKKFTLFAGARRRRQIRKRNRELREAAAMQGTQYAQKAQNPQNAPYAQNAQNPQYTQSNGNGQGGAK